MKVDRRLRNVKGVDMKIFQTPSYDRFCLFEMERLFNVARECWQLL